MVKRMFMIPVVIHIKLVVAKYVTTLNLFYHILDYEISIKSLSVILTCDFEGVEAKEGGDFSLSALRLTSVRKA